MISLIANHVFFPVAEWSNQPTTERVWETEVSEVLPGTEYRQAMRAAARRKLTFSFTAQSLEERSRFDARWDAAAKSGLACAPFFGRSCVLSADADAGDSELTIELPGAWAWQPGDYIALVQSDTVFDIIQVSDVDGGVLTLADELQYPWPAGTLVRPVIFGKFSTDKAQVITSWHESSSITIAQRVAERSVQLGAVIPPVGNGIGVWNVGSTFLVS